MQKLIKCVRKEKRSVQQKISFSAITNSND